MFLFSWQHNWMAILGIGKSPITSSCCLGAVEVTTVTQPMCMFMVSATMQRCSMPSPWGGDVMLPHAWLRDMLHHGVQDHASMTTLSKSPGPRQQTHQALSSASQIRKWTGVPGALAVAAWTVSSRPQQVCSRGTPTRFLSRKADGGGETGLTHVIQTPRVYALGTPVHFSTQEADKSAWALAGGRASLHLFLASFGMAS